MNQINPGVEGSNLGKLKQINPGVEGSNPSMVTPNKPEVDSRLNHIILVFDRYPGISWISVSVKLKVISVKNH